MSMEILSKKKPSQNCEGLRSCRGRGRTSTRQLASAQSLVVNPGRPDGRFYAVFILCSSPSRQEGMSAKNFITPQFLRFLPAPSSLIEQN